ncbi:MAG: TrlF family AAA-like ATPase [Dehalococcoidia bacterium]
MATSGYARFRKADLQMQTPVDRHHWTGAALDAGGCGLPFNPSDDQIDRSARRYADRCREVGIEIIGLTDHNLGGPDAERFHAALAAHLGDHATIFPGFEVAAKVGRGAHFLCLFEPGTPLSHVSDVLSELGLPAQNRFSGGDPSPSPVSFATLAEVVQKKHGGVLVAAHAIDQSGVCNDKTLTDSWSKELINDPNLLCVELPKPRSDYEDPSNHSKAAKIVRGEDGWGSRRGPLAVINSSDCKRLHADDALAESQTEGFIGRRATWLKMDVVSIEGLRQAFLDPESRIAFPKRPDDRQESPPDRRPEQARIVRLEVSGVEFLADQVIELSPQLNTLIGGGGTGKSTILEYLRVALDAERLIAPSPTDRTPGITTTLAGGRAVVMCADGGGGLMATLRASGSQAVDDEGQQIEDLRARFPIRAIGQREIYAISNDRDALRALVDHLGRDDLGSIAHETSTVQSRLDELERGRSRRESLDAERKRLIGEIDRHEGLLRARAAQAGPLAALAAARAETEVVETIDARVREAAERLREASADLTLGVSTSELDARDTPNRLAISELRDRASKEITRAASAVEDLARSLDAWVARAGQDETRQAWRSTLTESENAYRAVAVDDEASDDPKTLLDARRRELGEVELEIAQLDARMAEEPALLARLGKLWARESEVRERLARDLGDAVPMTGAGSPYVTLSVDRFGQLDDLRKALRIRDGRSFSDQDVEELVRTIDRHRQPDQDPVALLCAWADGGFETSPLKDMSSARRTTLALACSGADGRRLRRFRIADRVTVTLYRQDGARAGTLDEGLSVGQRCIAVLTLLLATGDAPILIDQPEDEIDNEFIYRELVPLIRHAKSQRQVILATHDANIPVNGDAEMIYALDARAENGRTRGGPMEVDEAGSARGGKTAVGALDRAAVRIAVSEVMEGSQEAFERRRSKYGF